MGMCFNETVWDQAVGEEIDGASVWDLAQLAGVSNPDRKDSPGAEFLTQVAEEVAQFLRSGDSEDFYVRGRDAWERNVYEMSDSAVPHHTYTMWKTYVDLTLWEEDNETGSTVPTDIATGALFTVAERLGNALCEAVVGWYGEATADGDDTCAVCAPEEEEDVSRYDDPPRDADLESV